LRRAKQIGWSLEAGCLSFVQSIEKPGNNRYAPFLIIPTVNMTKLVAQRRRSASTMMDEVI
jgi:hypothetical protein